MRGATRSSMLAVASLTIVIALGGCAGRSWQFWKSSGSTEPTAAPAVAQETSTPTATPISAPAIATAAPAQTSARLSGGTTEMLDLPTVRFRPGQVNIGKADVGALDGVVRWLKDNPAVVIVIEGHTDDLGTRSENMAVGEKRAASIMRYLVSKGIDPARISTVSYGADHPICWDRTTACRAQNRRADLVVRRP